jgi:L-threonylcarbamoyladenylate synthase
VVFYHAENGAEMGRVLTIDPQNPDAQVVGAIAKAVRHGAVIAYPTDTVYGLGCLAHDERALARIFQIKQRAEAKGVLLLVPDVEWVPGLCAEVPDVFHRLAARFWPGPVTFLLPANSNLPVLIRGERNLVGIRNPDSAYLRSVMERIPGPLVSTSANLSGVEPARSVSDLERLLLGKVDLLINGGEPSDSLPSTVVDLSVNPPRVVRAGGVGDTVRQFLEAGDDTAGV